MSVVDECNARFERFKSLVAEIPGINANYLIMIRVTPLPTFVAALNKVWTDRAIQRVDQLADTIAHMAGVNPSVVDPAVVAKFKRYLEYFKRIG